VSTHAFLSPSGAPAWLRCPAKPHRERGLPDTASRDSGEGTAAHALRAMCLTEGTDTGAYLGRIIEDFEVTDEMAQAVQRSLDVIRAMPGHIEVEVPLDISHITGEPGARGTSDTVILDYERATLVVDDYKHGAGVYVSEVMNEQFLAYAVGAARRVWGDPWPGRTAHRPRLRTGLLRASVACRAPWTAPRCGCR
jgi:hypothetical protein